MNEDDHGLTTDDESDVGSTQHSLDTDLQSVRGVTSLRFEFPTSQHRKSFGDFMFHRATDGLVLLHFCLHCGALRRFPMCGDTEIAGVFPAMLVRSRYLQILGDIFWDLVKCVCRKRAEAAL